MKWSAIVKDQRYISASSQQKLFIQEDWYKNTITTHPNYLPELDPQIKLDIFGPPKPTEPLLGRIGQFITPERLPTPQVLEEPPYGIERGARELGEQITAPLVPRFGLTPPGRMLLETWRRITEAVKAPIYEYQRARRAGKPIKKPITQAFTEAIKGLRVTPGREIVKGMGVPLDDPEWIQKNPGKHFAAEMLGAWYETYGTDPIILTMWAKSVPYARKANLFNQLVKETGRKGAAVLAGEKPLLSPKVATKLSEHFGKGFWGRQAQIAGGLEKVTEAELRAAIKAVRGMKYVAKPPIPKIAPAPGIVPKPPVAKPPVPKVKAPPPITKPPIPVTKPPTQVIANVKARIAELEAVKAELSPTQITELNYLRDEALPELLKEAKPANIVGNIPKEGLVVANVGADDKIYIGKPGQLHFNLSEKYSENIRKKLDLKSGERTWKEIGFIDSEGKFLNREEALTKAKDIKSSIGIELDAADYREQVPSTLRKEIPAVKKAPPKPAPKPEAEFLEPISKVTVTPEPERVRRISAARILPKKAELLKEIDMAITKAPTLEKYDTEKKPVVRFKIDGGVKIFNNKDALSKFRKAIMGITRGLAPTVPTKPAVAPVAARKEEIGELAKITEGKGYFTDGRVIIKGTPPAKAKFGAKEVTFKQIQGIIKTPTKSAKLQYYLTIEEGAEGVSAQPVPQPAADIIPKVLFKSEKGYSGYQQFRFNAIRNRYPNATYGVTDKGMLVAYIGKEPVATLMQTLIENKVFLKKPPLQEMAQKAGLLEPEAPVKAKPPTKPKKPKVAPKEEELGVKGFVSFETWDRAVEFLKGAKSQVLSKFDIEAPFRAAGAPKTGIEVKTYFSKRSLEHERGKQFIKRLNKLKLTSQEAIELTYISAQPTLFYKYSAEIRKKFSAAYKIVREYFDYHKNKLIVKKAMVDPWPKSLINRLQDDNVHIRSRLLRKIQPERRTKLQAQLQANLDVISFIKRSNIQFVHLPLRMWMRDLYQSDPPQFAKTISRFFKKRETADIRGFIQHLIAEGLIKPADADIRNIIAAYSHKIGHIYGLSDIINSAMKEGLGKELGAPGTETWQSLPPRLFPEGKGIVWHPAFASYIQNFINRTGPSYRIGRLMGYSKMLWFYNPFILPAWDMFQAFWLGSIRTLKTPVYMWRSLKSMVRHNQDYWDAVEHGAMSKPFIAPFDTFMKEIEGLKLKSNYIKYAMRKIERVITAPLDVVMRPIWHIAWGGDHLIRMMSYHYLIDRSFTPTEAAQMTALFHGDYAAVPPATRKILNKIFITPTFKIVMTKLVAEEVAAVGRILTNASHAKGKRRDLILTAGILVMLAGLQLKRIIFKKLGFKEEQFALRYSKEITDEEGQRKEMVVYSPTPDTIHIRYFLRWKNWPSSPDKIMGLIDRIKWDLHPFWLTSINILENRRPDGSPVYNPFDEGPQIAKDMLIYGTKSIIRIVELVPDTNQEDKKLQTFKAMQKDIGTFWTGILSIASINYLRKTKEERAAWKMKSLESEFKKFMYQDPPKTAEQQDIRVRNFQKRLNEILKDLE